MGFLKAGVAVLPAFFAGIAGVTDWRSRRIPNWLTVPGVVLGIAVNTAMRGWTGTREAVLGAGLGLLLLLPFVWIRSLGAGDWKLIGALGAFLGPRHLMAVLFAALLVAGVMAFVLVVYKRRVGQTLRNILRMFGALFSFHMPAAEVSLDNPDALKIPFGVAVSIAVVLYTVGEFWGVT